MVNVTIPNANARAGQSLYHKLFIKILTGSSLNKIVFGISRFLLDYHQFKSSTVNLPQPSLKCFASSTYLLLLFLIGIFERTVVKK